MKDMSNTTQKSQSIDERCAELARHAAIIAPHAQTYAWVNSEWLTADNEVRRCADRIIALREQQAREVQS